MVAKHKRIPCTLLLSSSRVAGPGASYRARPEKHTPKWSKTPKWARQVQEAWARTPALWGLIRDGSGPAVPTSLVPMCPGAADFSGVLASPLAVSTSLPISPTTLPHTPRTSNSD